MNTPVKYTGTFQCATGYGSANRAFVTALHMAGVDTTTFLVVQTKDRTVFNWEGELAHQLQDRDIPYKVKIIHLTPDIYKNHIENGIYHIGHLFWETDRLPIGWADHCNSLQEIWTSSPHMAKLLKDSGVKVPISWFPQPIDITNADKNFPQYGVSHHRGFMFYSIFQWIERKNPKALLTAYWKAFSGREDVSLLLKTFRLSYDSSEFEKIRDDIRTWKQELGLTHYPRILLVKDIFSTEQMMRLHATGDCYVQVDRGEGWSRTIQEALLLGKTVVSTARGGIHEYLKDTYYYPVASDYVPVVETPWIKFYTSDQNWAEVDQNKLIQTMQFVIKDETIANVKGVLAKDYIKSNFSYHKVGEMMKKRLEEIYKKL